MAVLESTGNQRGELFKAKGSRKARDMVGIWRGQNISSLSVFLVLKSAAIRILDQQVRKQSQYFAVGVMVIVKMLKSG